MRDRYANKAEPADVSIIVRDGSPEPACTVKNRAQNPVAPDGSSAIGRLVRQERPASQRNRPDAAGVAASFAATGSRTIAATKEPSSEPSEEPPAEPAGAGAGANGATKTLFDQVERTCRYALAELAPQDLVIGPLCTSVRSSTWEERSSRRCWTPPIVATSDPNVGRSSP